MVNRHRFATFRSIQLAVNGTIQKTPQKHRKGLFTSVRTVAAAEEGIYRVEKSQFLLDIMAPRNSYVLPFPKHAKEKLWLMLNAAGSGKSNLVYVSSRVLPSSAVGVDFPSDIQSLNISAKKAIQTQHVHPSHTSIVLAIQLSHNVQIQMRLCEVF